MGVVDLPLFENRSVVLDASGNGSVDLGPSSTRQTWNVTLASVAVTSNVKEPTAVLRLNGSLMLGGTYTGSQDSTDLDITMRGGYLRATWTGGDAHATATLTVSGSIHIGG